MWVEFGNTKAHEGYRDPQSDDPDQVLYRPIKGKQTTRFVFPEGMTLGEAFQTMIDQRTLEGHFQPKDEESGTLHKPVWVDSDSEGLRSLLAEHFDCSQGRPDDSFPHHHPHPSRHLPADGAKDDQTASAADKD